MSERIDYPKRVPISISEGGDIEAHISGPDTVRARRFSLDMAEEALHKLAPQVIPHVVERLAGQIAHEQRRAVEDTVHAFLRDRAWAEPIIREAIKDAVREVIRDMLKNTPLGDAGGVE